MSQLFALSFSILIIDDFSLGHLFEVICNVESSDPLRLKSDELVLSDVFSWLHCLCSLVGLSDRIHGVWILLVESLKLWSDFRLVVPLEGTEFFCAIVVLLCAGQC